MALRNGTTPLRTSDTLAIHRKMIQSFASKSDRFSTSKVMKLYDSEISTENVKQFLTRSAKLFTIALVQGKLNEITYYV